MFSTKTLDPSKVTFAAIISPGVKHIERKIIPLSKIYVQQKANKVRKGKKYVPHIQRLIKSFQNGINYSKMPPVVRKKTQIINGVTYEYELLCGDHRLDAFISCGFDSWIFDVYDVCLGGYSYIDSVSTLQLQENDHEPELASTSDDIVNTICYLIDNGSVLVENTEASIDSYVETYCPNMHWNTKGKIVKQVIAAKGSYQDIITYTPNDLSNWLQNNSDYKNEGEYDKKRKKHGWTCRTRYEPDTVFSIIKKFHETGKESYIIAHTSAPTGNVTVDDKREAILYNFEKLNDAFVSVIDFYNKYGRLPWSVEGFFPQDVKANENMAKLIPPEIYKTVSNIFAELEEEVLS